ncbi:MAG TPA: polysaccharide deacetylase family protein [Nitrolancea sp.]|nr:polysaccharide deacetylase family protein [Nitrolancea sp.]
MTIAAAFLTGPAWSIKSSAPTDSTTSTTESLVNSTPTVVPTPSSDSPAESTPTATPAGQTVPVPILMYHYIRPDPGHGDPIGRDLSVTPEQFAEQTKYLADHHFTTMTMAELADVRAGRLALPANPIILTFDDGYQDFYTHAWPLLREHGFKATSFIVTAVVGQPPYVTWEMIDEMQQSGLIEFGSHTVTHKELPYLSDGQAKQEIEQSKQPLEEHLGHPVRSFSYPVGRFSDRDVEFVRSAGYEIAVTTMGGHAKSDQDPLRLPRVRIHGATTLSQFGAMLE